METARKLILVSTSPRRAELLRCANIPFEVVRPDADERQIAGETPVAYAIRTAREKAESFPVKPGAILLGADTVVALEGRILGKPVNSEDAKGMLRMLSGKLHEVITGVCLRSEKKALCFHVATTVLFRELSDVEIATYVATGDPLDKAGAYAIQNGAAGMVRRIDGSYSNVVGLPLCEVIEALEEF